MLVSLIVYMVKLYQDKRWLNEQYWKNELSLAKIAKRVGCSQNTVKYWMRKYNISCRDAPEGGWRKDGYRIIPPNNQELYPLLDDKNWLAMQHWGFNLSLQKIGKLVSLTLTAHDIVEAMERLNIPMWSNSRLKSELQTIEEYHYPDWLVEQHYDNKQSMAQIGKASGVSDDTISKLAHSYGLPINMQIEHTERDERGRRWCFDCKKWLDIKMFNKNKNETDGLHASCKDCRKKESLDYREIERAIAIQIYSKGTMNCEICGNKDIDVLTFDHIEGGGFKHRKDENIKAQFYRWLKRNNYPDGFRILCWNCQHIEHINKYLHMFKIYNENVFTHHAKKRCHGAVFIRDKLGRKYCPSCQRWLNEREFSKSIAKLDGLKNACKRCRWIRQKHDTLIARIIAIQIYSDGHMNCALCGNEDIDCLSIDHVKGGGGKHREKIRMPIESWLEQNNYPDGFRILCHNCNHLEYLNRL